MRIHQIAIDGYGRFTGLKQSFVPGLQVIIGPNEQGKSTIRNFISDMLYGQKRSTSQRLYEESNELRIPWNNSDCYGGTLTYELGNGHEIEVFRNFDRNRESIQVFDRTNGRDITGDFDRLRNREINFATTHLGLSKEVFLGMATINHFTLDDFGDTDALLHIREKILSLADSGNETNSADASLKRLQKRIAIIGQPNARTKPLPAARTRLAKLNDELKEAHQVQQEIAESGATRRTLLAEINAMREQRLAFDEEIRAVDAHESADRLKDAEGLIARIDTITQHCFALSDARDFPLDENQELERTDNTLHNAKAQLERTLAQKEELSQQLEEERQQLGDDSENSLTEIPEEAEANFLERSTNLQHLVARSDETKALVEIAETRLDSAKNKVEALPDFSRIASDPVEWITQLASSFAVAQRSRDEACAERDKVRNEIELRNKDIAPAEDLFGEHPDFLQNTRTYELKRRVQVDQTLRQASYLQALNGTKEEVADRIPGFIWLASLVALFLCLLLGGYYYTQKPPILVGASVAALAVIYYLSNIAMSRKSLKRLEKQIEQLGRESQQRALEEDETTVLVEDLLEKAECTSVRELEALYDQYREAAVERTARLSVLQVHEERAAEDEHRVSQFIERIADTFAQVGEQVEVEEDIEGAAARAVARYQEYREAKRNVTDSRDICDKHTKEGKRLDAQIEEEKQQLHDAFAILRETMGDDADNEDELDDPLAAVRAYRTRIAAKREQRARTSLLQERLEALEKQVEHETKELATCESILAKTLANAQVSTVEDWHAAVARAEEYRDVWAKRQGLDDQLNAILRGQNIDDLRNQANLVDFEGPAPTRNKEAIKSDVEALNIDIDDRLKEEHALHISLTERSATTRSINEIEEEISDVEHQLNALQLEHEATAYAMTLIEDLARDKHARIAPTLAKNASNHLATITRGGYDELLISRDLTISVRIPQTNRLNENPEKALSKGTVDQVYLALRLALVQSITETGKSVPMLLDDPFANYDDARLENTMRLIADIGNTNQVLLFTCREDVVRAAELVDAPIVRL